MFGCPGFTYMNTLDKINKHNNNHKISTVVFNYFIMAQFILPKHEDIRSFYKKVNVFVCLSLKAAMIPFTKRGS